MKIQYIVSFLICMLIMSCGSIGNDATSIDSRKVQNPIRENTVPVGISSFSLGVENKFPYTEKEDSHGIGFISVIGSVRKIATNELYIFPELPNQEKTFQVLQQLIENGYSVTHEIHILNGPSMRKSQDRWVNALLNKKVSDEEFSYLLQTSVYVQDAVLNLFAEVIEYAKRLENIGVSVLICPELEDNQSNNGFKVYLQFLQQLGWERSKIVRNGGHIGEIEGIKYEAHNPGQIKDLREGDILNTDGKSFYFNSDTENHSFLYSENEVRSFMKECEKRGIIFYLWYAPLQGLVQVAEYSYIPYPEYMNRHYKLNNPKALIGILLGIKEEEIIVEP